MRNLLRVQTRILRFAPRGVDEADGKDYLQTLFQTLTRTPEMTRHLITSALPYINGIKHLGNLVGSMLPSDVFARFQRARGNETLFICATDEHGSTTELAALEAGQDVAAFCAEQHAAQKTAGEAFGLSWDYFGRSSSPQNQELTIHFARQLWKNGHLDLRTTKQVYSVADKRFLPDRYVIGTCPHCGYERARGDQCENCTRVLDPVDLINPRSAISGSASAARKRAAGHPSLSVRSANSDQSRAMAGSRSSCSSNGRRVVSTSIALMAAATPAANQAGRRR